MPSAEEDYERLMAIMREITVLRTAGGNIYWDLEVMMPARGLVLRSEQLSLIDRAAHRMLVSPEVPKLLKRLDGADLGMERDRDVELARRAYVDASALPEDLVAETSRHQAVSVAAWKKAKAAKDFSLFRDELRRTIELRMEAAALLKGAKGSEDEYDALLDEFEPGMTADAIGRLFGEMRSGLIGIVRMAERADVPQGFLSRSVGVPAQRRISALAMSFLGYETKGPEAWGRLDETEHPFTTGYYDDVRITTHYYQRRFISSLYSVLHEAGHALYEHQIPRGWMFRPIGSPASYGVHESQSRFVENIIGRSRAFISYIHPELRGIAPRAMDGVSSDALFRAVNAVQPSTIRIEADEVTYGLHIIARFEMERALFAGELDVDDLPGEWSDRYEEYLGVRPANVSEGVLQDTHWAGGSFGYFPSYALGNIYGGMMLDRMSRDVPDWRASVESGDFSPVGAWLGKRVHAQGSLRDPAELVRKATGRKVTVKPYLDYLREKTRDVLEA